METFKKWLHKATEEEREAAATQAGTTVSYFWHLSGGHRKASPELAKKLELATGVPKSEFRPDIWG